MASDARKAKDLRLQTDDELGMFLAPTPGTSGLVSIAEVSRHQRGRAPGTSSV